MASNLKQHILQTASELFYSQGIKATGVDAIVKAAGTTKMSLYKYFPSKDDLVLAHLQKSAETMQRNVLEAVLQTSHLPKQQLLTVFDVFATLLASPQFRGCPFINASAEFAEPANPVQQASAEFYQGFQSWLADLATQAKIKQPEQIAKQLSILIAGAIVSEQIQPQSGAMALARLAAEKLIE